MVLWPLTSLFISAAMCVVLFPGEAHISNTISPGLGFKARTHATEGKFWRRAAPDGRQLFPRIGHPEAVSVILTATPLQKK